MTARLAGNVTTMQRESRELRPFFVRDTDDDGDLIDVTSMPVDVSFARRNARPSVWTAAAWVAGGPFETPIGLAWAAEAEIGGPSTGADIELAAGEWRAYVRVTGVGETPVLEAGVLIVE